MFKSIQMLGSRLRVYLLHICSEQGPKSLNLQNVVRDHTDFLAASHRYFAMELYTSYLVLLVKALVNRGIVAHRCS